MIKYFIYGEGTKKPIRKTKHENDALVFASDIKNLQQHGCMTIIREDDDGNKSQWNPDTHVWENMEGEA